MRCNYKCLCSLPCPSFSILPPLLPLKRLGLLSQCNLTSQLSSRVVVYVLYFYITPNNRLLPPTMHSSSLFMGAAALLLPSLVSGQNTTAGPDAAGKYWLYGEGICAAFIPYGASISNLIIKDQYGIDRDIVGGFDNASYCERHTTCRQHLLCYLHTSLTNKIGMTRLH